MRKTAPDRDRNEQELTTEVNAAMIGFFPGLQT